MNVGSRVAAAAVAVVVVGGKTSETLASTNTTDYVMRPDNCKG